MLQNILNLDGVAVLNKKQQRSVNGGNDVCHFTITTSDGGSHGGSGPVGGGSGNETSGNANDICVDAVINNSEITRCQYDCEHDGLGQ